MNASAKKEFSHFEINYLNECKVGDEIDVSSVASEGKEYVVGEEEGKISFISLIY